MKRGFWVSILLHILIMALPVTIPGVREFKEVEIFIMEEKPNPVLYRPAVQEQRSLERSKTTISKPIAQELIEKSNSLLKPLSVEEKKVENESVMEPQMYDVESRFEEKSEPVPQPLLASILEAERREKEAEELARIKEEEARRAFAEKELQAQRERAVKLEAEQGEKEAKDLAKEDHGAKAASKHSGSPQDLIVLGEKEGPRFLFQEKPVYPHKARRLGKEGKVVLRLIIDECGNLLNVEVLEKAGYGFTEAAIEAVRKSTFLPAKKNGKPIASQALLLIRFQLEKN